MKQLRLSLKGGKRSSVPQPHLLGVGFADAAEIEAQLIRSQMSDKKTSIDIREDKDDMWRLEFPYDFDFIQEIKAIPYRERSFDKATNFWWVHDRHLETITESAKHYFDRVTRIFERNGEMVWLDCNSGVERVQQVMFPHAEN